MGLFVCGVLVIGFGAGLFGHGTLTVTMNRAPKEQTGLALGAWGAVQATAAGVAVALGGIAARHRVGAGGAGLVRHARWPGPATGYAFVYAVEIVLLAVTIYVMSGLVGDATAQESARMAARAPARPRAHGAWQATAMTPRSTHPHVLRSIP